MRCAIGLLLLVGLSLIGATCLPLIDLTGTKNDPPPPTQVGASVTRPTGSRTVPTGATVSIEWSAVNQTGQEAVATMLVRKREDLTETILMGGVAFRDTSLKESFDWDTTNFPGGKYNIIVRVSAGDANDEVIGSGVITINTPPDLTFTEPFEDTTLANPTPGSTDTPTVVIRWSASDPDGDGKLELGVDTDSDHTSGNEIVLVMKDLPKDAALDSFSWNGNDMQNARVDAGTYQIYAKISDGVNTDRFVPGLATITVPAAVTAVVNALTEPSTDRQFLATDASTKLSYTIVETDDVLIDIKIDTDDNHQNGNEITILSQRLVSKDTHSGDFDWNGQNTAGVVVPDNIYRPFLVINRASGTPTTLQSTGLIFRRSEENKPLIGLLAPATDQTVTAGQFVTIQWRDDDPSQTSKVFLHVDDDNMPQEATETGQPEIEILANRDAKDDGVSDSFNWQVPASLAPGTYFIFAYIDRDGAAPFEHVNVAPGRIIIKNPTTP